MTRSKGDMAATGAVRTPEEALALCKHHWEMSGVDPAAIEDMLDELRGHLDDAVAHGRRVDAVIGPDLRAFARDWARAREPRRRRWLRLATDLACALVVLALFGHLVQRTVELDVTPGRLVFTVLLLSLIVWWRPRRGKAPGLIRTWLASFLLLPPAVALDFLVDHAVLATVPLWLTALFAVPVAVRLWWQTRQAAARRADRAREA